MKFYGIRNEKTGVAVGFITSSNDGDFCTDVEFELDLYYPSNVWLVKDRKRAEFALKNSTEWFNANYNTPKSSIKDQKDKKNYYVFEIEI